ncbi:vanadium-dependent haloperoxidase [Muricauda sp. SCSIO 64092]|uniref:vanadium-dependent haloperoxidase n=1 Tax=Allomuricauda sp. SCSIO 64092 TaxID=2908842 RepID=UPI001FF27484|nr:vanadium-dependent haloperoxidase [Muricauda sp. SCSIO 64092]UOY08340.1 vanadium-dependent haloperoxidase [Muricauda sp. SCSIO 64092]
MRKIGLFHLYCSISLGILFFYIGCSTAGKKNLSQQEVIVGWANMATYLAKHTPSNSPTYASRGFGYIALTMYESIVHGYGSHNSLEGQLNGLQDLPKPEGEKSYNWILALNAGQSTILKHMYQQTSDENKIKIDSLENVINEFFSKSPDTTVEINDRSTTYGNALANAIYEWSKTDGGHRGYLDNFDKNWIHPTQPGSWKPPLFAQSFSHHPLHPHWGQNRTFLKENQNLPIPYMIPYDTISGSPYYNEFRQVYEKDLILTKEEKEAAIWWGDDPDVTFTPPGHSYYIATLAIEKSNPSLMECAEVYAKTAIAVADSFINCWKWKYHFFSERPNTFIPQFIDQEWESFWPDPPFPSFPSGHAINAAAMATILENEFGEAFHFTDRAHEGRERDEIRDTDFVIRSFDSFWEAAQETADSRFYGGIHTPQDNNVGLVEGAKIAKNVLGLDWHTKN